LNASLKIAHAIDALNRWLGYVAAWLVLAACLISAGNAAIRYALDRSSNAWLEVQWYMFAGTVMLGAAWVLKVNEHVRVDLFYSRLSPRNCAWLDLAGLVVFLLPSMALLAWLSWPLFIDSWRTGEMSSNAGGLIRWPAKLVMPLGFALVCLQGVSELIKRIAHLAGQYNMDTHYERPLQ
jgi:TRAP-type mannitol/chloroaromatic compound transport system permease small subunit